MAFIISEEAKTFLKEKDPYMRALIKHGKKPYEQSIDDPFEALIDIVVGQQISEKAKESIVKRMYEHISPMTQETIASISEERLRELGLSKMKAQTIKRLASIEWIKDLKKYDANEIEKKLMSVKGIGKWSVEMFHFVCLKDTHIFSLKDIGILNGLRRLYKLDKQADLSHFKTYFYPHESAAASYIWMVLELDQDTLNKIHEEVKNYESDNV